MDSPIFFNDAKPQLHYENEHFKVIMGIKTIQYLVGQGYKGDC